MCRFGTRCWDRHDSNNAAIVTDSGRVHRSRVHSRGLCLNLYSLDGVVGGGHVQDIREPHLVRASCHVLRQSSIIMKACWRLRRSCWNRTRYANVLLRPGPIWQSLHTSMRCLNTCVKTAFVALSTVGVFDPTRKLQIETLRGVVRSSHVM